jgi:hypothetical protein
MGISKVVGMCTGNSCHNMLSLPLVTTTTTTNIIPTIYEILVGLLMLLLLTPWAIALLTALAALLDLLSCSHPRYPWFPLPSQMRWGWGFINSHKVFTHNQMYTVRLNVGYPP